MSWSYSKRKELGDVSLKVEVYLELRDPARSYSWSKELELRA